MWSVSGAKSHCDRDCYIDLTTMELDKEGETVMDLEEREIIDLDKEEEEEQLKAWAFREAFEEEEEGLEWLRLRQEEIRRLVEKQERDHAEAEEDNLSDFWYEEDGEDEYNKEMDRMEQYDEETDFEWYESEEHARLLAAVKERERQRSLVTETQTKLANAEEEKQAILRERGEMLARAEKEKQDLVKERDKVAARYQNLVEQLEQRLECPVCLAVPKEAPVITCKEGHLACSSCFQGWLTGGRRECPYCRTDPLVGAKSLLADLVIKSIEHECNLPGWPGCSQKVHYDDLADHQKKCTFRLVKCPGSNKQCNMMLPFYQVLDHVNECSDMTMYQGQNNSYHFTLPEDCVEKGFLWDTVVIHKHMLGTFFVRVEKDNSQFTVEIVMKGTEEDCEKVNAEIAIKDPSSGKAIFNCNHHPRPMGKENTKEFCLSVTQAALSKIWSHDKELNSFVFVVEIKIA